MKVCEARQQVEMCEVRQRVVCEARQRVDCVRAYQWADEWVDVRVRVREISIFACVILFVFDAS